MDQAPAAQQKAAAQPAFVAKFFDVELLPLKTPYTWPLENRLHMTLPEQPHAGYGVVCTPRAPTTFWITNRTTTGFDVVTNTYNGNNFDCLVYL